MPVQYNNAAIWYVSDSFDASGKNTPIVGRTAAGEGFLKALATHGGLERLYCFAGSSGAHEAFRLQIKRLCRKPPSISLIEWAEFHKLAKPGCLYIPEPALEVHAWNRRSLGDQRQYSICGVTHTTAHYQTVDAIGALLTAPMQSWDALICTSSVVATTVNRLLTDWADYLEDKGGGRIRHQLQLPVIPLGIDSQQFEVSPQARQAGYDLRQQIGARDDDIVVLYLGRLSVNIKSNPYSMLSCLEKSAQRTGRKIHLVLAGWFQDNVNANAFSEAVKQFCPSINAVLLDGRQEKIRHFVWFAADIFVSLVDNIQETFGISPLEAMAAGLPVVVSDWDGYRDTVIDGKTGFRIPTLFPEQGAGSELAIRYNSGLDSYENYLGHCSAATTIDETACVNAFVRLIEDAGFRQEMGENGRRHVAENFDWKTVIKQYQELWTELADRRQKDVESVPGKAGAPVHPLRQDPFRLFAEYPSKVFGGNAILQINPDVDNQPLDKLRCSSLFSTAMPMLLAENKCREILRIIKRGEKVSVGDLELKMKGVNNQHFRRTVAWLVKTGLISIE